MEPMYWIAKGLLRPSLGTWFRWHIEGSEHIPPSGPAIVAFNHIAYLDPLAAAYVIDKAGRRPRFLGKSELFQDKRIGWILRGIHQIEVKRGTKDAQMALDHALAALKKGEVVVMFPEGTITTDPDLQPMAVKSGVARLALASGVPVIPGALWGTANVWPKGYAARWRPRQDILVRIGEPLRPKENSNVSADWDAFNEELMGRIGVLLASLRPAVPDRRRPKRTAA